MTITAERARELLYAAHDAWNKRDIERLLSLFVDDLTYWSNVGGSGAGPNSLVGKTSFRAQVAKWSATESISVPSHFRFAGGLGRASVEFYVRDIRSGHKYTGTFRQIASYRDNKISRLEEYHDALGLQAFIDLISQK